MHFCVLKPAFAAMSLALALALAAGQPLRAGEEYNPAFSSFGSGMTLGEAMANGSPAPRVGMDSGAKAGIVLHAPAAGRADQQVLVGPAGLAGQTSSLADVFADALWRKKAVRTLYQRIQAD